MAYKIDNRPMCLKCNRRVGYKITASTNDFVVHGATYSYTELAAVCSRCSAEIYVPLINDLNCEAREAAYRKK